MDENLTPEPENDLAADNRCINCKSPDVVDGFAAKLCAPCRKLYANYPIPLWVKLFGAAILVVMCISMIWLPKNLEAAIALERGIKAEKAHNYLTAQHQLEKALNIAPSSTDVLGNLMISSFYNSDFDTFYKSGKELGNRTIEDKDLLNQLNLLVEETNRYSASDDFAAQFKRYKENPIPDSALSRYFKQNSFDIYAGIKLASNYVDENKYSLADTILSKILQMDPDFIPAISQKSMVKRELGQTDSSLYYADKLLSINHQSIFAKASKARTLLKAGKNSEGLNLATEAYDLNRTDGYSIATMAIAHHCNKNYKQRDAFVALGQRDSVSAEYITYALDVISNKVKFQN